MNKLAFQKLPKLISSRVLTEFDGIDWSAWPVLAVLRNRRARFCLILVLSAFILFGLIGFASSYFRSPDYELGVANSLLPTANQSMADRVRYDAKQQVYNFNTNYSPAVSNLLKSTNSEASATAYQDASKGVTVTDPLNKINLTMTPKFDLAKGRRDSNRIIYPLSNGNGWVVYGLHTIGVKESILLERAPGNEATFDYSLGLNNGLTARLEADGSIGIYGNTLLSGDVATGSAKDAALLKKARENAPKHSLLFTIPAPTIKGLANKPSTATAAYGLNGNNLTVTVKGLENASYPLNIDPSIYIASAQQFMSGNNETNIDFDVADSLIQKGKTTGARFNNLSTTMSLPVPRWDAASTAAGGYVYEVGGNDGSSNQATIYWAKFNPLTNEVISPNPGNGTCGSWCTDSLYNLPAPRVGLSLVAYNGYLYAIGGEDASCNSTNGTGVNGICNTVYIAKIGANGEPQLWNPTSTDKSTWAYWYRDANLSSTRSYTAAVAYNNRMYLLGGKTDTSLGGVSTVESVDIKPTGTLSAWSTSGMVAMPSVRFGHDAHIYNGYLYLVGGDSNGTVENTVDYIKINDDGSLDGSWISANSFSIPRMSWGGNFSTIWGGYLYVSGGCSAISAGGQCTASGISNAGTPVAGGSGTSVELASINADGSIGFWGSISNVSNARIGYGLVGWRNTIYTIGGCTAQDTTTGNCTAVSTDTYYGVINQDGDGSTVATSQPSGTAPCTGSDPSGCNLPGDTNIGDMLSATAIINGYLYIIGGCTSNDCSSTSGNTLYAAIDSDGQLRLPASCTGATIVDSFCVDSTDPIPGGVAAAGTAIFGGDIYIVGGQNGSGLNGNVYHVAVNNDGSLNGAWIAQSFTSIGATSVSYTFAYARANPAAAGSYPGNLYIFGGCTAGSGVQCTSGAYTGAVYKCNIDVSGSVASCSTTGQLQIGTVPGASGPGLALHAGAVYAGYIYLVGGVAPGLSDLNTVRYAKFDNSNNIVAASGSGWAEPTDSSGNPVKMSTARSRGAAFGYNGYLYALGGYDSSGGGTLSDIQFAKINVSNGSLEQFNVSTITINQRWGLSVPVSNSYAYVLGGCTAGNSPTCTSRTNVVQTFQIYNNNSGAPAGYSSAANLFPTDRFGGSAAVNNNYIYIAGGCVGTLDCNNATNSVEYAPLNPDGSVGTWNTAAALPGDRVYGQLEQVGGTLYYLGGQDDSGTAYSTIYYAVPDASGNISSWSTASGGIGNTSSSAAVARTEFSSTVWNGRIFVLGGYDSNDQTTNTVFISPQLNSGGDIPANSWSSGTPFNVAREGLTAIAYANNLYLLGGYDGSNFLSDVQYAQINANGTLSSWSYSTSLPRNVSNADGFAANGYMYIFGGKQSAIQCTASTYVAPISANTTIASGNNPTGLGQWFQTNERFAAERSGLAAVYHDGRAYLLGGSCGTLQGGAGNIVLQDDFDPSLDSTMWSNTTRMTVGTSCGTLASGNALSSTGNQGGTYAEADTVDASVPYGGTVSFYLKRCNTTTDNIVLQYSSNGGSGWSTIATYNPSNFATATQVTETIPSGAWTANTRFRWIIDTSKSSGQFAIDNMVVTANTAPPLKQLMFDNFDPDIHTTYWSSTNGMSASTACGVLSSGNALVSSGGNTSQAITNNFDLQYGGVVSFYLRIPGSSNSVCRQPNSGQNLLLQYSTNNGSNWTTMATYDESAFDTPTSITTAIPSAAYATTVRFRWYIPNASAGSGAWAIDDVTISAFKPILTYTGLHRVVSTSLLAQPQVAQYSIMFDTDSDVFPQKWLLNGVDNSIGAHWHLQYQSMTNTSTLCTTTPMTDWGQTTSFGNVTLGQPETYTPLDASGNNTNCARFFYLTMSIDSSEAYGYPEDVSRGPTITDLTLEFTADPSKRLMHGRTFTGGIQQPDDTPF